MAGGCAASMLMKRVVLLCVLVATRMPVAHSFAVIFVAPSGADTHSCGYATVSPCKSFKWAIETIADAEPDVDVQIQAFPGVYDTASCGVRLRRTLFIVGSSSTSDRSIIDCGGVERAFYTPDVPVYVYFANLTIRNGFADDSSALGARGAGILIQWLFESASIGPVFAEFHGLTFINCDVVSNGTATLGGGGLAVIMAHDGSSFGLAEDVSVLVDGCVFQGNDATNPNFGIMNGGGLWIHVDPSVEAVGLSVIVRDSQFYDGFCTGGVWGQGAGLAVTLDGWMTSCTSFLHNLIVVHNVAEYGAGVYTEHDGSYYNGTFIVSSSVIDSNHATFSGGGFYTEDLAARVIYSQVILTDTVVSNNTGASDGAGVYTFPAPAEPLNFNSYDPGYRAYEYVSWLTLINTTVANNSGLATSTNGGGVGVADGGFLTLQDCLIEGNFAGLYGGGVFVGSSSGGVNFLGNTIIRGNKVLLGGGAQLASFGGGVVGLDGVQVYLDSAEANQVLVLAGGNVTYSPNTTRFYCPVGTEIEDSYRGLYGPNAQLSVQPGWSYRVKVSTFEFSCETCPTGFYTLQRGYSDGTPGKPLNPICLPCPYGGTCAAGHPITAAPGFWGAPEVGANGTAEMRFLQCPEGYCCAGAACTGVNGCSGNRQGRLCGRCKPGYGESVGTSVCRLTSDCTDGAWFWPLMVFGLLIAGSLMLRNGEVWCPRKIKPTGKAKLASYFYQMVPLVSVPTKDSQGSTFKRVLDGFFSIFRLQLPGNGTGPGACVIPGMSVPTKLSLGYWIPLLVAAAMVFCYYFGKATQHTAFCTSLRKRFTKQSKTRNIRDIQPSGGIELTSSTPVTVNPLLSVEAGLPVTAAPRPGRSAVRKSFVALQDKVLEVARSFRSPLVKEWSPEDNAKFEKLSLSDPAPNIRHMVLPLPERMKGAVLNWFLFAYSAILSATLRLLSCVRVPGESGTFLFQDATRSCSSAAWQAPLFIVVTFVVGFAVLMPLITFKAYRRRIVGRGVYRVLCEQYTGPCYWWESVLIMQRLVLSFLNTFAVTMPVLRLVLATLVCLCCTVGHILARPMQDGAAQRLQTILQFSLLVVVISNITPAHSIELADGGLNSLSSAATQTTRLLSTLDLLFVYIVPILAIVTSVPASSWVNPVVVLFR